MTPTRTNIKDINTQSPSSRKATQRERLLAGMLATANRDGYAGANVSAVIAHAGVSRPTFYDYFADKDDCFLAVHRDISGRLLEQIRHAVAQAPPEQATQAAIRRLIQRAEAEPAEAQFLANEAMAGGPRALDERDRTIGQIERIIEQARTAVPPATPTPDLPTRALIGGAHWLLSPRLRRGEYDHTTFAEELIGWIESHSRPAGEHRWRTLRPGPTPPPSPHTSELPMQAPPPLPAGRSRLSAAEITRNQRERILYATAQVAAQKGYTAATIADITTAARIDRRVFYTHYRDKQQAFLAVHELYFQQLMAVVAGAFFSAHTWPERVWQGTLAAGQFDAAHPNIVHIGYIEAHAVGAPAIQRIDETRQAFTIFLQEGAQHATNPPTRTAYEAIAAAAFEIGYHQARRNQTKQMTSLAPHVVYTALTPFLGPRAVDELIDAKLRESGTTLSEKPA
jgi:AcrR family transcriptional regulator